MDEEFAAFVRAREHGWLRAAYLVCGDLHEAQDLLQEALVKLARAWPRVRHGHPDAYLRQIVYRDAISLWRSRSRERRRQRVTALPDQVADPAADVDARIDAAAALDTLTAKQRAIVVLRFLEDRSERDTAHLLGISTGTVKSQTHAALQRLRAALPDADLSTADLSGPTIGGQP
ncbi:MAG TPA: SigE family RNA polymerase sigma factor [Dermatophilaceae bacterium]|nr:SigE family RNA polymerase sigma factor [Dermatophilaceae bacterium]